MTNGDNIRQMSNEELAELIQMICVYGYGTDSCLLYPSVAYIKEKLEKEEEK